MTLGLWTCSSPDSGRLGPTIAIRYWRVASRPADALTSDLIAQVRINLESVELAAGSSREMSGMEGQAIYDRIQSMIELLRSTQDSWLRQAKRARRGLRRGLPARPLNRAAELNMHQRGSWVPCGR